MFKVNFVTREDETKIYHMGKFDVFFPGEFCKKLINLSFCEETRNYN